MYVYIVYIIKQINKLLRKAYKDYLIDRFKLLLNQIS